jgi:hypothetical protein
MRARLTRPKNTAEELLWGHTKYSDLVNHILRNVLE